MIIIGGTLNPKPHDGSTIDVVYGVDASGAYLGLVPSAQAAAQADRPPPKFGEWRWQDGAWQPYKPPEQQALEIELARDARLAGGVQWNGRTWYADATFQQQVAAYMQIFASGLLDPAATVSIRAMDKVVYQLTLAELRDLAAALMTFVQGVWADSWAQKAAIGD